MRQRCKITDVSFEIDSDELSFLDKISPVIGGRKFPIPPPQICPEERQRRRLAFRNLRNLYRRTCDSSGQQIISMYSPDSPHLVYHTEEYFSDKWNALNYGVDYDPAKSFFEQLEQLYRRVPTLHHYVILSENCEYINGAANCRNCYLSFNMDYCEDCYYVADAVNCQSCVDCLAIRQCELCYECVNCERCYGLSYSDRSENCIDSYFLTDCRRCRNCIACTNLQDKEFYVFNERVSKAEFERIRNSLTSRAAVEELALKAKEFSQGFPKRFYFGHSNENFSGNEIVNVKNSFDCYFAKELENCRYCNYVFNAANCYDYNIFGDHSQWMYQCLAAGINCSNNLFCMGCWNGSSDNLYLIASSACSNCFGCVGLSQKKYCILNKQYDKEGYEKLASEIILNMMKRGEWGEFFPLRMSPFAFQNSVAAEELPLEKTEAIRRGYSWIENSPNTTPKAHHNSVPDELSALDSSTNKQTFDSPNNIQFRIIIKELEFHQKQGLAFSNLAPEDRHQLRLKRRPQRSLHKRNCENCKTELFSTSDSQVAPVLLCERCFQDSLE